MSPPFKTLAVCGPTASGKSAVGIELARALQGEVVNADSVQVYRGFSIGAAKVSAAEMQGVPHHLLDIFSPDAPANVAEFRREALAALGDICSRGKVPVVVGGSGMYFTVLLHGLADVPSTPPEVRAEIAQLSPEEAHAELMRLDPESAGRLHVRDRQRVTRALEIIRVSGRTPSDIHRQHRFQDVDVVALVIVLCRPRDELYARIDQRATEMVRMGLVEETKELLATYGEVSLLDTLGYKQARAHLAGALPKEDLAAEIALHTRRFAKRQMTFWRNEPRKRGWLVRPGEGESEAVEVSGFSSSPERAHKRMTGFRALQLSQEQLVDAIQERLKAPLERSEVWYVQLRERDS
jgi:tRNA dimethylallyltransferase